MENQVELVFQSLKRTGVKLIAGVPDSLMEGFCSNLDSKTERDFLHVPCANEGGAIAIAAGHFLATSDVALVYFQNSGLGNCVNPLTSLTHQDVYGIPMVLLIGWRGEPGKKDEPQHNVMGGITQTFLEAMGIPFKVLDGLLDVVSIFSWAKDTALIRNRPVAILVTSGFFAKPKPESEKAKNLSVLSRSEAVELILSNLPLKSLVVGTTGMIGREIFAYRNKNNNIYSQDFMNVGAMGHSLSIGIGMALSNKSRRVFVIDGDGSALMHLGSIQVVVNNLSDLSNLTHIILNNHSHDSVGGQATCNPKFKFYDFYKNSCRLDSQENIHFVDNRNLLAKVIQETDLNSGFRAIEVEIRKSMSGENNLPRPNLHPNEYKTQFLKFST